MRQIRPATYNDWVSMAIVDYFVENQDQRAALANLGRYGDYVLFREYVTRGPASDGSELVEPFEVIAIYSFEGGKCSRVEFLR